MFSKQVYLKTTITTWLLPLNFLSTLNMISMSFVLYGPGHILQALCPISPMFHMCAIFKIAMRSLDVMRLFSPISRSMLLEQKDTKKYSFCSKVSRSKSIDRDLNHFQFRYPGRFWRETIAPVAA